MFWYSHPAPIHLILNCKIIGKQITVHKLPRDELNELGKERLTLE